MSRACHIHIWKKAPFLRLILPLMAGIVLEFFSQISARYIIAAAIILVAGFLLFTLLPEAKRYKWRPLQGIILSAFMVVLGGFVTWQKDVRHHAKWYGKINDPTFMVATINEPPVEKAKSFKALATIESVISNKRAVKTEGKILIYFIKETASQSLKYGDQIVFQKPLQRVTNSGNPAAFDYVQYCAFQQIFHQVYLKSDEWILLKENKAQLFQSVIFKSRDYVLNTLQKFIGGTDESALAKALLIGYRIDLDKDLVQAYSNVGVVHLIAISGMHLALIYYLLLWISKKIPLLKRSKLMRLFAILFCLWFFSFLTGAPASVLRASVMFSFITIGDSFDKRNSIYNSLAISAFVLLCYDPYMLWDVGFQLSYLAVSGIVVTQKYIYKWCYFKNKILNAAWKLASVSLAAQLFTLPVCIYYFHQFPLLFLLSNLIAIPLSTIALWGCIAVLAFSPVPVVAAYVGKLVWGVVWLLNHSVLVVDALPFALWNGLLLSLSQTVVLYFIFVTILYWLIKKNRQALNFAIAASCVFGLMIAFNNWQFQHQKKIVVYNIAKHSAVDFIGGRHYHFAGDPEVIDDRLIYDYNLKPARIAFMLKNSSTASLALYQQNNFYQFYNKKVLMVDTAIRYNLLDLKIKLDYIIVSKNPAINMSMLAQTFDCDYYIFDASNSQWKIEKWKKECEELHLHFHSVSEQGAFVTDL